MIRLFHIIFVTAILLSACTLTGTLYEDDNGEPEPPPDAPKMTLILNKMGEVSLEIIGTGSINIDWGDGAAAETRTISNNTTFQRVYNNQNVRTITIEGDNITRLNCSDNQIIAIDVSEITTLVHLFCSGNQLSGMLDLSANILLVTLLCDDNRLTGLNVAANTALRNLNCSDNLITNLIVTNNTSLETLNCSHNSMNAAALSSLLSSLHDSTVSGAKTVMINNNPGAATALNKDVAMNRGWTVIE